MLQLRAVFLLFSIALLSLTGCDNGNNAASRTLELEDPDFRQGILYSKQNEYRLALECFLKVIDSRKGAAESHLEAGRMLLELEDPLPAIYHFNQYIRLKPASEQAKIVKKMINTAEKIYAKQLPGRPLDPDEVGVSDQAALIRKLQAENAKLLREVSELSRINKVGDPLLAATTKNQTEKTKTVVESSATKETKTYTIQSGDSLYSISRKFYGNGQRANDIYNANRDKLKSPTALAVGVTIVIPQ
jgi:LysM repeat protein